MRRILLRETKHLTVVLEKVSGPVLDGDRFRRLRCRFPRIASRGENRRPCAERRKEDAARERGAARDFAARESGAPCSACGIHSWDCVRPWLMIRRGAYHSL